MGIDVRKAVVATINYLESFKDLMGSGFEDLRLEEVELSEDKQYWLITLGFTLPRDKLKQNLLYMYLLHQNPLMNATRNYLKSMQKQGKLSL